VTRPRPEEDAVRRSLREHPAAEGESENGAEAAGEEPAAEAVEGSAAAESQAEPEAAEEKQEPPAEEPEDELTATKRERDEYLDLAKRAQADFENYRKRSAKDVAAAGTRARVGLIREILPVVDNLERALSVAPEGAEDGFAHGVRLVYMELEGVLSRSGIEKIEPKGDVFDPNVHEAISVRAEGGATSGTVLDVVEKGYRIADMVIRPARVVVAG
jgi:molecular chaperone GrpE